MTTVLPADPPRFAVGYQPLDGDPDFFCDIVDDYRAAIAEVYFALPGEASGRAPLPPESDAQIREELTLLRSRGVRLNLLLNAACFGAQALSSALADRMADQVRWWWDGPGLDTVTTLSPFLARELRTRFPGLELRASVNLRLGTVAALRYAAPYFDSYTLQREYNRDPERLAEVQRWAATEGKSLVILANSGCLNWCSFQSFHDNAVAHEADGATAPGRQPFPTLCREHYADRNHGADFLRGSWIRPEDLSAHTRIFGGLYKLATRQHGRPRMVIGAYASGRFRGNLLDLMEPGHGPTFHPWGIANDRFPGDWFERSLCGGQRCASCRYCDEVFDRVSVVAYS